MSATSDQADRVSRFMWPILESAAHITALDAHRIRPKNLSQCRVKIPNTNKGPSSLPRTTRNSAICDPRSYPDGRTSAPSVAWLPLNCEVLVRRPLELDLKLYSISSSSGRNGTDDKGRARRTGDLLRNNTFRCQVSCVRKRPTRSKPLRLGFRPFHFLRGRHASPRTEN